MPKWTPEQEAAYAIANNVVRSDLSKAAQLEYDRLIKERAQARSVASAQQMAPERQPDQLPRCSGCGEELTPNARFCASCGEPVNIRSAGRSSIRDSADHSSVSGEQTLQEFTVKYVTFYDGSGHRLGPSECTLTSRRLIINDVRGGMHQILLRDISGTSTPSRIGDPKTLRISLPAQAYDITFSSKDQKYAVEASLGQAIRGSLS